MFRSETALSALTPFGAASVEGKNMGLGVELARGAGRNGGCLVAACLAGLALGALAGCGSDRAKPSRTSRDAGGGDGQQEKRADGTGGLVVFIVDRWTSEGLPAGIRLEDIRGGTMVVSPGDRLDLIAEPPLIEEIAPPIPERLKGAEDGDDVKPQQAPPAHRGRSPEAGARSPSPTEADEVRITLRPWGSGRDAPPLIGLDNRFKRTDGLRWLDGQLRELGRDKAVRENVPVVIEAEPELPCVWVARAADLAEKAGFQCVLLAASKPDPPPGAPSLDPGGADAPSKRPAVGGQLIIVARRSADTDGDAKQRDVLSLITVAAPRRREPDGSPQGPRRRSVSSRKTDLRGVEDCLQLERELQANPAGPPRPPALLLADEDADWSTVQGIIEKAARFRLAPVWLRTADAAK